MEIVRAESRHADKILDLLVQVNNVHNDGRPDLFLRDKTKYTKQELLEILADDARPVFVAEEDGKVLGYAFGVFQSHKEDNNWPDIVTFYVDDICVDETVRGKHVGSALYGFVKDFARSQGCYNLTLNVWEKNESAKGFYEAMGLTVQKIGMEAIL